MNAVVKISGVTGRGLAQLMQVLEGEGMKLKLHRPQDIDTIKPEKNVVFEDSAVEYDNFRFAKVLEVKPEQDRETYLVTLRVFLKVWAGGEAFRLSRDPFLMLFRGLDDMNFPQEDSGDRLGQVMQILAKLDGSTCPVELYETPEGNDSSVVMQEGEKITLSNLMLKIFPRLRYIELSQNKYDKRDNEEGVLSRLREAQVIMNSLE